MSELILVPTPKSAQNGDSVIKAEEFFKSDSTLTEKQKKWCRCVLKVADKQPGDCNKDQAWFETRDGRECVNPYAICSKSVGTSVKTCGENYDFESLPDNYLIAYAELHQKSKDGINIEIPNPYVRGKMLENIKRWKEIKGK